MNSASIIGIFYTTILFFSFQFSVCLAFSKNDIKIDIQAPQDVWIDYSEQNLVINWDSVGGAIGYNVYRSNEKNAKKDDMERINQKLITSGTRFVFIWSFEQGKRERSVKGNHHYISITSVFDIDGDTTESDLSIKVSNNYFKGFSNMTTKKRIKNVFLEEQKSIYLPVEYISNKKKSFIQFMTGPGRYLAKVLKDSLNFHEVGACDPISTIALKLMDLWGLHAWRTEGVFIEEFHIFIVINIEDVEYVVDFAADQYISDVAPVIVPRDLCFLSKEGNLNDTGKPVYQIEKIFPSDAVDLNPISKKTRIFHNIYNKVYNKYFNN